MALRDPLTGIAIFLLAAGVFLLAGQYNASASLFPQLIAVVIMIAAAGLTLRGFIRPRIGEPIDTKAAARTALVIGLTIVYVIAVAKLGYMTASLVFIPATAWALGARRPLALVLTTIIFLMLMAWLFLVVFQVPLPRDIILQLFSRG